MKLSEKDFEELSSDPLKLFYHSIKSHHTKRVYERNLKEFLTVVLSNVLKGTFEQRAKQFVELGKSDPAKLSQILYAYSMALKKKTELPKSDPEYIGTSALKNRFKPIRKFL